MFKMKEYSPNCPFHKACLSSTRYLFKYNFNIENIESNKYSVDYWQGEGHDVHVQIKSSDEFFDIVFFKVYYPQCILCTINIQPTLINMSH